MYSSGYTQVNKFSPEAKKMQYRSKGKSCGYYLRIVFFFSSLIQSLIIVSLVLFLLYGNTQDTAVADRVRDLEDSFSRLSIDNVALKQQRKNLTNLLNATLTAKARAEFDLRALRQLSNISVSMIQDNFKKLQTCNGELIFCKSKCPLVPRIIASPPFPGGCNCGLVLEQMKARCELIESNFTQTMTRTRIDREQAVKEKDKYVLETIHLRREKSTQEKELELYKQKSKDEFSQILSSVSSVSKALLEKINSLFPRHIAFQLTCPKQREHLEQIHSNCTSLSREVEDKLQRYLNSVGDQVSNMQVENNHLKAENWRLSIDYRECSQNRTAIIEQHKQSGRELQQKHDQEKERLLMDKLKLNGEIEVLKSSIKYKTSEVDHLNEQLKQLNVTCMMKTGLGGYSGGLGSRPSTPSQSGWNTFTGGGSSSSSSSSSSLGLGSTGSGSSLNSGLGFNKPGSTGTGSSSSTFPQSGSSLGSGNTGLGFNKPGSTGADSSRSTYSQSGSSSSSTGSGFSKPASTGGAPSGLGLGSSFGSVGTGSNKPAESGRTSTSSRSSSGSTGSSTNTGLSSTGSNKPTSNSKSSSVFGFESPLTSSGSTSKSGSTSPGFSWPWNSGSSSGQSKTESAPGRTTSGSSNGGAGSSIGGGKTSDPGGVTKHIQELQRLINPSAPQDKQDLSRMLG